MSSLNVRHIKVGVYVMAGFLSALAGVIVGSRLDSAQPWAGLSDLLSVIAVVVIGGASLAGGSGSTRDTTPAWPIRGNGAVLAKRSENTWGQRVGTYSGQ